MTAPHKNEARATVAAMHGAALRGFCLVLANALGVNDA